MARRKLTREQALDWNQEWSHTDRRIIEENLNRLDPRTFYVPPSGGYVGCIDAQGRTVMTLFPGYVKFKPELVPAEGVEPDWPGVVLSTFRPHASPTEPPEEGELL